ncbi:conserved hypothetical protein [Treponema primitia ZAS-2]|uniref:Uncharacterized protein n=1 Tax=Treponema primitia (strain ATCC BAA-887 / DSM 12427 / ZAS-2) TaxID=545694 RepID=F5YR70_TREPZ|nr:hypothetical protein [Treponema primitia]AEF83703.1 conserved hypothetical protein [Treponema primitia ZAS-2]
MKKIISFLIILLVLTGLASAQTLSAETPVSEKKTLKVSIWAGLEWNMNARTLFSLGGILGANYAIKSSFAAGIKNGFSYNFNEIVVLEPEGFFRWYFLQGEAGSIFLQGDLGASFIFADSRLYMLPLGGISGGIRIYLKNSENFFLEPYGRLGYPFVFGIGITGGYSF